MDGYLNIFFGTDWNVSQSIGNSQVPEDGIDCCSDLYSSLLILWLVSSESHSFATFRLFPISTKFWYRKKRHVYIPQSKFSKKRCLFWIGTDTHIPYHQCYRKVSDDTQAYFWTLWDRESNVQVLMCKTYCQVLLSSFAPFLFLKA